MMVADALTKDAGEPQDLLCGLMKLGRYQLAEEGAAMAARKEARERRQKKSMQNLERQARIQQDAAARREKPPMTYEQAADQQDVASGVFH